MRRSSTFLYSMLCFGYAFLYLPIVVLAAATLPESHPQLDLDEVASALHDGQDMAALRVRAHE